MFFFVATLAMGTVDLVGGTRVATRFRVFTGLPVSPVESVLRVPGRDDVTIPLYRRSVVAGYLRVWLPFLTVIVVLVADSSPTGFVAALLFAAASAYAWLGLGRLSRADKRKRLAYATWLGAPIDPGLLPGSDADPIVHSLRTFIEERCPNARIDYRDSREPSWLSFALESDDPELLISALTLARLERRKVGGAERAALDRTHDALWAKLVPLLSSERAPPKFVAWEHAVADTERRTRRQFVPLSILAGLGIVVALPLVVHWSRPLLVIVNLTGASGLTVTVDGEPVAEGLPASGVGADIGFVTARISEGEHDLVAFDGDGAVLEGRRLVVPNDAASLSLAAVLELGRRDGSFVYAPRRSDRACFFEETLTYSAHDPARGYDVVRLDMSEPVRRIPERIDHWFVEAPESIEVRSGGGRAAVERRALRAGRCPEPSPVTP